VLITGSSGFIGRNLAEYLGDKYQVCAPSSFELDLLHEDVVRGFLKRRNFDVVIHTATTRSNRRLGTPPDMVYRNCRMFFNLARNEHLFGKMLHFGSGAEYDRRHALTRVAEEHFDTTVPVDDYGFSKYICAKAVRASAKIVNLRLFAVFGKYEAPEVRFISNACARVVAGLPIVIRQDTTFDYLYVTDLARITAWFIENTPSRREYNVCSGTARKLTDLAAMVASVSGRDPEIRLLNHRMGAEYSGSNQALLKETLYEFHPMQLAIGELYSWYAGRKDSLDPESLRFDGE
jgi:GDP-L-fucose synthase